MNESGWVLDPRLAEGSTVLFADQGLMLRAMLATPWPWLVLIPQVPGAVELFDLPDLERQRCLDLACALGAALKQEFAADKINIAALGNVVSQLHIHVIARCIGDAGWPAPVWGRSEAPIADDDASARLVRLQAAVSRAIGPPAS